MIQILNSLLPSPYRAHNSKIITFTKEDPRAELWGTLKREFDIIILDKAFISPKLINPHRIEFAVETKPYNSSLNGIKQAEDAFLAFESLKFTYATNFGSFLYKRERGSLENHISLSSRKLEKRYLEIAQIIVDDVKQLIEERKKASKITTTISETEALNTLKECMEKIQREMVELPDESKLKMTEHTLIMWKQYDETDADVINLEYNIKRAASYIIVNQFLFYHILQKKSKFNFNELKPLDENEDNPEIFYTKYLKRAIKITKNYRPIFEADMLSLLPLTNRVIKTLNEVINTIVKMKIEDYNTDILGKIFHGMIPMEIRRQLAAYYTANAPAYLLAKLAINKPDVIVGDLACGSGTLLVESYHVKKELYQKFYPSMTDDEIHKRILEDEIYGNDITLFATHIATINLAIQNMNIHTNRVNITSGDGLEIVPQLKRFGDLRDYLDTYEQNGTDLDGKRFSITYPLLDLVIMNPPFSQQKGMDEKLVDKLIKLSKRWFKDEKLRMKYVDAKMGLHGYFLLYSDHLIKSNGTIAMILPTSTFITDYTTNLLEFFKDRNYYIKYVMEILSKRNAFSEDSTFKEYMVIFIKGKLNPKSETSMISFLDEFSMESVPEMINAIKNNIKHSNIIAKKLLTSSLYNSDKWTDLFTGRESKIEKILESTKLELYQNEVFEKIETTGKKVENKKRKISNSSKIKIKSGFHPTFVDYLMVPNKVWNIEKVNEDIYRLINTQKSSDDPTSSCSIPSKYVLPSIRKSGDANVLITEPNCYVLNLPYILPKELTDFRRIYLHWAESIIEEKWREDRKKGYKRIDIIKNPSFQKVKKNGKEKNVVTIIPWYSHAYHNKCAQKFGNLIHCKKYRISTRRSIVFYTKTPISTVGTMYYIKTPNDKFYASWCNSALYFYLIINNQRTISKGYFESAIRDLALMKFPKYSQFSDPNELNELIEYWEKLSKLPDKDLCTIPKQLGGKITSRKKTKPLKERIELDKAWLIALGVNEAEIDDNLKELYDWILNYLRTR